MKNKLIASKSVACNAPTFTANKDRHIGLSLLIALAITFLGCSSDDGGDEGGGGNANSGSFTIDTIYTSTSLSTDEWEKWSGNGTVQMEVNSCKDGKGHMDVGEIVNGKLSFNLPSESKIEQSCFIQVSSFPSSISVSPSDVKIVTGDYDFNVTGDDGKHYILKWAWREGGDGFRGYYWYFSKAAKVIGGVTGEYETMNYNINAVKGWNKVYSGWGNESINFTTDIDAMEFKPIWYIYPTGE